MRGSTNDGRTETNDADQPASKLSRRRLLQTSAGALGVGLGVTTTPAAAQMGSVPGYAEFVPAGVDELVLQNGAVEVTSVDLRAMFELLAFSASQEQEEESDSQAARLQLEPQVLGIFAAVTPLSLFEEIGLGSVLPAAAAGGQESAPEEVPDLKTDRITSIPTVEVGSGVAVSAGSYDSGAIRGALDEGPLEPSDTNGVYVGDDPRFGGTQQDVKIAVTWSDQYIISAPPVELVTTVAATKMGNQPRLYEQNGDLARQLSMAGNGAFISTNYSPNSTLQISQEEAFVVDYSAIENVPLKGYTQSNTVDLDVGEISAISTFNHPSSGDASESALSAVGEGAAERSVSSDGRYVTIESVYRSEIQAREDDSTSDDSTSNDSTDSTDDSPSDSDSGSTDGSESESGGSGDDSSGDDGSGGDGSSDGGGPGFGVVSALTGLGGAGYLLKQRMDTGENRE